VRIVIVDVAVSAGQEVQEKRALDCCRMYLFKRIVRGMLRGRDSFIVSAERRLRAVERQMQGREDWLGEVGGELLDNAGRMVGSSVPGSDGLLNCSVLEGTWAPEPESGELKRREFWMMPVTVSVKCSNRPKK
jgi:hypothetical protein